jgi:hypothetical protein
MHKYTNYHDAIYVSTKYVPFQEPKLPLLPSSELLLLLSPGDGIGLSGDMSGLFGFKRRSPGASTYMNKGVG